MKSEFESVVVALLGERFKIIPFYARRFVDSEAFQNALSELLDNMLYPVLENTEILLEQNPWNNMGERDDDKREGDASNPAS